MPESDAEAHRERFMEAIKAGRVVIAPDVARGIREINLADPDFTVTDTTLSCWGAFKRDDDGYGNDGGFEITWQTKSAGFGRIVFYLKDGELRCHNEGMGPTFIASVFAHLVGHTKMEE
jgi:hypothetical protein